MSVGFFEESSGNRSSMRLMSFIALIAAIIFGILSVNKSGQNQNQNKDDTGIYITFGFLLAALAPKALQKFAEQIPQSSQFQALEQTQAAQTQAAQLQVLAQLQALAQLQSQNQAEPLLPLPVKHQLRESEQPQTAAQRLKALSQRGL